MRARDARFDGQFITGVHSTGIYCRPSCPAVSPKPTNVSFYLTAAAAHEAGLRACKRCLPDAVPGSPEWDLRDDLAARAMRLIADGVVEREGVPGLAARLGYTTRHLTRVVTAELGAGPLALARAHRAQTARVLLTSTAMPAADVAFASGFGSVRQFNETIREVYDRSPLELRVAARTRERAAHRSRAAATAPGVVHLRLPARPPFDAAGVFAWLEARARRRRRGRRRRSLPAHAAPAGRAGPRRVRCGLAMAAPPRSTSTHGSRPSPTCRRSSPGCDGCSTSTPTQSPSTRRSAPIPCSRRRSRPRRESGCRAASIRTNSCSARSSGSRSR